MAVTEKHRLFFDSVRDAITDGVNKNDWIVLVVFLVGVFGLGFGVSNLYVHRYWIRRRAHYFFRRLTGEAAAGTFRQDARFPVVLLIPYGGGKPERTSTINLSTGGMFIKMASPYELNTSFNFKIQFPNDATVDGVGAVRWVQKESNENHPRGMGVMFMDLSEQDRNKIRHFIKTTKRPKKNRIHGV